MTVIQLQDFAFSLLIPQRLPHLPSPRVTCLSPQLPHGLGKQGLHHSQLLNSPSHPLAAFSYAPDEVSLVSLSEWGWMGWQLKSLELVSRGGKGYGVWKEGQEVLPCRESFLASAVLGSSTARCHQREAWVEMQQRGRQIFKKGYCAVRKWSKNEKGITRMRRCWSASSSTEAQCKCAAFTALSVKRAGFQYRCLFITFSFYHPSWFADHWDRLLSQV